MYDFTIKFIAWFIFLCLIILPPFLIYKAIKKIVKLINQKRNIQTGNSSTVHQTEWSWDEERQLWVHPKSEKGTTGKTEYRYQGSELFKGQPSQPAYFHHEDTSFKTSQQPKTIKQDATYSAAQRPQPKPSQTYNRPPEPPKQEYTQPKSEYKDAYQAIPILTRNEFQNYKTLNEAATKRGYIVWSKVRLADIVKPRNDSKFMSHFGKIKAKHVDFVILDQNMRIKAIIELDDNSHDRADRKARDEFVDKILQDCGYKIIHTRYITPNILDGI